MITDMLRNKKLNQIVTELFIRGKKAEKSLVFLTQPYFAVPKNIRLNSTHYFVMKISSKRKLQQITFNHSSDIEFKDFIPFGLLTLLLHHIILHFFRKNLLEKI